MSLSVTGFLKKRGGIPRQQGRKYIKKYVNDHKEGEIKEHKLPLQQWKPHLPYCEAIGLFSGEISFWESAYHQKHDWDDNKRE